MVQILEHFFSLQKEMLNFLQNETEGMPEKYQLQLSDEKFIDSWAFLANITNHLNILNIKFQAKKQNISQVVGYIEDLHETCVV